MRFLARVVGPILLAAWTITVWDGDPAWLLIGAAVSGIAVLCAPVRAEDEEEDSHTGQ